MAGSSRRRVDFLSADGALPQFGKAWSFREAHEVLANFSPYDYFEVRVVQVQSEQYLLCEVPFPPNKLSLTLSQIYYDEKSAKIEKARRLTEEGNRLLAEAKKIRAELRGKPVYTGEQTAKPLYRGEEEPEDAPDQGGSDDQ